MRMRRVFYGAAAVLMMSAGLDARQERRQSAGGAPPYDLSAETTVTAVITGVGVDEPVPGREVPYLAVTVKGEALRIFLGPREWMEKQNFDFPTGATAEITGVGGYRMDGPAMQPRKIKVGSKTLTFRDASGRALWEGRFGATE